MKVLRRWSLPADAAQVRVVRRDIVALMRQAQVSTSAVDAAALLASELLTNAVQHGRAPIDVELSRGQGRWEISVTDRHPSTPVVREVADPAGRGMGMWLVSRLSQDWGTQRIPGDGKRVWFTVVPS